MFKLWSLEAKTQSSEATRAASCACNLRGNDRLFVEIQSTHAYPTSNTQAKPGVGT